MKFRFTILSVSLFVSQVLLAQFVPITHQSLSPFRANYDPIDPSDLGLAQDWFEDEIVQLGYIPVTLLGAIPDDDIDDTEAIQNTILLARDYNYVTYIPQGEYLISETLNAPLKSYRSTNNNPDNLFWNELFFQLKFCIAFFPMEIMISVC